LVEKEHVEYVAVSTPALGLSGRSKTLASPGKKYRKVICSPVKFLRKFAVASPLVTPPKAIFGSFCSIKA